jgi:hypothetical protein
VLSRTVVAVLKTDQVFFIERADIEARVTIQVEDGGSVFNDEHELCATVLAKVVRQALLVFLVELIL